jgi:hypothetical protein
MQEMKRVLESNQELAAQRGEIEELPLRVADDWEIVVARSNRMAEVIDRHLDFESKLQGRYLRPITLCPEQKVSLVSDLSVI